MCKIPIAKLLKEQCSSGFILGFQVFSKFPFHFMFNLPIKKVYNLTYQKLTSPKPMDFKFREKMVHQNQRQNPNSDVNGFNHIRSEQAYSRDVSQGLSKYAKKPTNIPQSLNQSQKILQHYSAAPNNRKSNIKKYFRAEPAPKNQFKKYLGDANNVFFEDRESLAKLNLFKSLRLFCGIIWLMLFVSYIGISFVKPFQGKCPTNAKCGVYANCYDGFEYNSQKKECILSGELLNKIEAVCEDTIQRIQYEWGNQQCQVSENSDQVQAYQPIPRFKLDQLLSAIQNREILKQLKQRMQNYLSSQERQSQLGFEYQPTTNIIYPTLRLYSISCRLQLLFKTKSFKLGFPGALLVFCLISLLLIKIRRHYKAKNIYQELKERTLREKNVNISYAKEELEKVYGKIDEQLWRAVDYNRNQDREIGYLQDDFLYWQAL